MQKKIRAIRKLRPTLPAAKADSRTSSVTSRCSRLTRFLGTLSLCVRLASTYLLKRSSSHYRQYTSTQTSYPTSNHVAPQYYPHPRVPFLFAINMANSRGQLKDMRRDDLSTSLSTFLWRESCRFSANPDKDTVADTASRAHRTVVPYTEPEKEKESNDVQSTMASTLPMAAVSFARFHC